jgi:hypothetical protein
MSPAAGHEAQEIVTAVARRVVTLVRAYERAGRLAELEDADALAERMTSAVAMPSIWDERIGPFYDTAGVTRLLGISRQALTQRVERWSILAMRTSDGKWIYPTFQFTGRSLLPGLSDVLSAFRDADVDGWMVASWLQLAQPGLDGASPADWLAAGSDTARLRELALATAERWAS